MRGKSNFDEGLAVLQRYKILLAAAAIVSIAISAVDMLPELVSNSALHVMLSVILTLLEMPLYFGFIKLVLAACRDAGPSLGQLVEFYRPEILLKSLLFGLVSGLLIALGITGIALVTIIAASVTRSLLIGLIAIIGLYVLILMYMIKIVPMLFIFVEQPEIGVFQALSDGLALSTGWMKDLLLIGWGLFWRALILGIIPSMIMLAAGESSVLAIIVMLFFSIIFEAFAGAVIGSVWLELSNE